MKNPTTITPIVDLLRKHESLTQPLEKLKNQQIELQASVEKAIRAGDLDDEGLLKAISSDRLKLEMLPTKIAQVQAEIEVVESSISDALEVAGLEFEQARDDIRTKVTAELHAALAPIFSDKSVRERIILGNGLNGAREQTDQVRKFESFISAFNPSTRRMALESGRIVGFARTAVNHVSGVQAS